jgi:hypothetical protein
LIPIIIIAAIIGLGCLIAGLVTGNSILAWAGGLVLLASLVPAARFMMRRGAPDNKFPWE